MSYLGLARKYRPQSFDDLVGQKHATVTLINALDARKLAQAYIFSGPRGCGKTTTARLLAKALNCVNGPTPTPCGKCPQCVEIAAGTSTDDVLEIDGASNRGIDQIRELRDTVKYAPARGRYRIYIIDEAHQITDAGFNALLKTLEEPPPHAVFLMATTELHKFPATILSRCQRFQLRPITAPDVQKRLEEIARLEKLNAAPDALREVSRAAHGSLRDALSLLDQAIAFAPGGVTGEHIRSLLGLLPRETVQRFVRTLRAGDPAETLQAVQKAVEDGFDLPQLAQDLLAFWHDVLLWKSGVKNPGLDNAEELEAAAQEDTLPGLERALSLMSQCIDQMRRSESPRVTFELHCLEIAKKAVDVDSLLKRLDLLEKSLRDDTASTRPDGPANPVKKKPELTPDESKPIVPVLVSSAPPPAPQAAPAAVPEKRISEPARSNTPLAAQTPGAAAPKASLETAWGRAREELDRRKPSLGHFLMSAGWRILEGNRIEILCAQAFQRDQITANLSLLSDCLQQQLASQMNGAVPPSVSLQCVMEASPPEPARRAHDDTPRETPPRAPLQNGAARVEPEGDNVAEEAVSSEEEEPGVEDESLEAPILTAVKKEEKEEPISPSDIDPVIKKFLEKFPGKLKKIQEGA